VKVHGGLDCFVFIYVGRKHHFSGGKLSGPACRDYGCVLSRDTLNVSLVTSKTLLVIFQAANHSPSDQVIVLAHSLVCFFERSGNSLQFKLLMLLYLHIDIWNTALSI